MVFIFFHFSADFGGEAGDFVDVLQGALVLFLEDLLGLELAVGEAEVLGVGTFGLRGRELDEQGRDQEEPHSSILESWTGERQRRC